jgi:hypothetical protein
VISRQQQPRVVHLFIRKITNAIFGKVKEETKIVGWKTKRSSEKAMSIGIYDILSENNDNNDNNKHPEEKVNELTTKIIELAKRDL